MNVKLSHKATKFLDKISPEQKERIRQRLKVLVESVENVGIIPFRELSVRKLRGDWEGYLRMRIGKIRVIFRIDRDRDVLLVYEIEFRGDVYK